MKKDLIFTPILVLVGVALFLFEITGKSAHIAISVVGLLVLAAYTVLTKKEWRIPALEIIMRAFYGIALVTGAVLMRIDGVMALAIAHKVSAALFMIRVVALLASKVFSKNKA